MIKLSCRLSTIASFVKSDAKLVDVGCDHALLDLYLVDKYPNIKAIAVDVREGALNQARKNIIKYNKQESIDLRLGDGLDTVTKDEINTIVISGLGCPKIIEILTKVPDKLDGVNDLIIQSNTDYYRLRKEVCALGYFIANEKLVKENDIIYVVIHFQKGYYKYKEQDYILGPLLRLEKSELYKELITNDITQKEILYNLIPPKYFLKRQKIRVAIIKLRKELK